MKPPNKPQRATTPRAPSQRPTQTSAAVVVQKPAANVPPCPNVRQPYAAPAPPAVYRPQPLQKCLQPKRPAGLQPPPPSHAHAPRPARTQPQPARPQPSHTAPPRAKAVASQPRRQQQQSAPAPQSAHERGVALQPHASKPRVLQRLASKVVQATKLYPNLHPGAVESIDPGSVYKLSSFADQYRLRKTQSHGVYVPNQLYNFVRTSDGEMLMHNRYRHPSIAEGRQVLYAGEAYFNNGKLEWWSNGSGHYQPDSEDAQQAALPMDNFYSYQQVIKGEHKRKR